MNDTDQRLKTAQELIDQFIDNCLRLRDQFKIHNIDYFVLGEEIKKASNSLPARIHPMIAEIALSAPYLAEDVDDERGDYRDDTWNRICQLVENYANNRWTPTIWSLITVYAYWHNGKSANASISARVNRINGHIEIETASDSLRAMLTDLSHKVDSSQTDEWYLHNLARQLPEETADLVFTGYQINELLKPSS